MGTFWAPCDLTPVTNRGVELAEATFRGAGMSDRGPHDSGQNGPWARGYFSQVCRKDARLRVGAG